MEHKYDRVLRFLRCNNVKSIKKQRIVRMKTTTALLLISVFMTLAMPVTAYASDGSSYVYDGYIYDYWGNALDSPAAYQLERVIDSSSLSGISVRGFNDVCTSKDGRIFLVDTLESRVHVLDDQGVLLKSIKLLRDENNKIVLDEETGNQVSLTNPEGIFVHENKNEIYIADTGANRILVLDSETYIFKKEIKKPNNMAGVSEFKPSKIAVDHAGRIYVIVQSSYEGIIELNDDGTFSRYYGVNAPLVNIFDYFWKSIASDAQKEKMTKTYAPAFCNVAIDGEGFIFAVTYDNTSSDFVFRLNAKGENVLRQMGNTFVMGDIWWMESNGYSKLVDVAITDYGTYALIDKEKGRIFIYNFDGELLNVFGSIGKLKGELQVPTGIAFLGDKLIVTDSSLGCAYILAPTEFGESVLRASEHYYYGRWDDALVHFENAIRLNANYEIAYTGVGKNYLMKDEYKKAMYYFKLGNVHEYYSKAYNGYRGEVIKENFWVFALVFIMIVTAVIASEIRYHKKKGGEPA